MQELQPVNILVVDDNRTFLKIVQVVLTPLKQNIIAAYSGEEAIECAKKHDFAVILLDVHLPKIDGFQTAAQIRQINRSKTTPIIFMTALEPDAVQLFQGYNQGAVDFLTKPIPPYILKSKVSVFIQIYQQSNLINNQNTYIDQINENIQEKEIKIKEQSLFLELNQESIIICNLDHKIKFWNQGAIKLYGWKENEILGKNLLKTLNIKCNESFEDINKYLILNNFWKGEFLAITKDKQPIITYHSWTLRTDYKGKPIGYFSISYDITKIKKEQVELRHYVDTLKEKDKLSQSFIDGSFTEIKNSLNLVLGITQIIRLYKDKLNLEQIFNHFNKIEIYTKANYDLIEDLFFIRKYNDGEDLISLVPVNIYKLSQNLVETLQFGRGRNHKISFMVVDEFQQTISNKLSSNSKSSKSSKTTGSKEKSLIYLDEKMIWKMLYILVSNAIKYSQDKTHIEFQLKYEEGQIVFIIKDEGIGISPEEQIKIFKPFYRGKNTETIPGLGIGLHLVEIYVKLHQGNILISSIPGSETIFKVTIPSNLKPNN